MTHIDHVLLTRFNLPSAGVESMIRAQDGWLRDRAALFERYCAPSVAAQTRRGLRWIVYLDPESPGWLLDVLRPYAARGLFAPVLRTAVNREELRADLRAVVPDPGELLITTNLDNDDGLASDFSARVCAAPVAATPAAVYVRTGLVQSPDGLYLRTDRRNAFCSVRESWTEPLTAWAAYHNELSRLMPVVEVGGGPGWLQVVHGTNVSNRVRGRLVPPDRYRAGFGGLLDAPAPSSRSLVVDRCLRAPGRLVRDGSRAGLRRAAMRMLGKDGYGELKHRLGRLGGSLTASVRR